MITLLKKYPKLASMLPYVSLGQFPTPVDRLERLGQAIGVKHLYIKRDDISGRTFGGNKVRKLEFLLGNALRYKARTVLTFGGAGSNHALATAIYAKQVGLRSISILVNQPNAYYVHRNLLLSHYYGAELHLVPTELSSPMTGPLITLTKKYQLLRHNLRNGKQPHVITTGGSSPVGVIGFVNAALELEEQVDNGVIPEPDYVYVAAGTMGTAAGLILGLKDTRLKSKVILVRVTGEKWVNVKAMLRLIHQTNALLSSAAPAFPRYSLSEEEISIRHGFYGQQYALFTQEGMAAVKLVMDKEEIKLDGTYTGKAFATILRDSKDEGLKDKVVLFWNTLNSRDFTPLLKKIDYHSLPKGFHRYFEEDVQPLDKKISGYPDIVT
jgi:D-cysteine desulfhydrase